MKPFAYKRPSDAQSAVALVSSDPQAQFLAAGSNLIDHLKLGLIAPSTLVDVSRLPMTEVEDLPDGGLRVGANVRNSDLAAEPRILRGWPGLARAILAGASGQIRNQATTGGNLMQRTRCVYFQDLASPCNKRQPESGCSAREGYGRYNALLGTSKSCVATNPGDMGVALAALDARVVVLGANGERRIDLIDFHRLPGDRPEKDTVLEHGELITAIELPARPFAVASTYRKARDRASYAFALVSVAAALALDDDGVITDIRLAWGGIAHKPWRARRVEEALQGTVFSEDLVREAVDLELKGAWTTPDSKFKLPMVRNLTALTIADLAVKQ